MRRQETKKSDEDIQKEKNQAFFMALRHLEQENDIPMDTLIEKIKSALEKAVRKVYDACDNIQIIIDPNTEVFSIKIMKVVVEDEPLDGNEINIDVARKDHPNACVDDVIEWNVNTAQFGRAAATAAKQAIKNDLKDINRNNLLSQFQDKENECIPALVTQIDQEHGTVTLLYDKTELFLSRKEQIPGELLREGQSVKVYVTAIVNREKKQPLIQISRSRKELVKRLFEMNIPEIFDGTVEIKSISREAGSRTKIAVWSKDSNVDAVGACIGPKRSRISAIVEELNGEKIDIIPYSEKPEEFIAKALAPAEVRKVTIAEDGSKSCSVIVPNNQLSLAIGNKGQNAKLAAKLTGYRIDIKPEFEIAEEQKESE